MLCCNRRDKQGSAAPGATVAVSDGEVGSGGGGGSLGARVARYGRVLLVTAVVAFKIVEWWNRVEAQVGCTACSLMALVAAVNFCHRRYNLCWRFCQPSFRHTCTARMFCPGYFRTQRCAPPRVEREGGVLFSGAGTQMVDRRAIGSMKCVSITASTPPDQKYQII